MSPATRSPGQVGRDPARPGGNASPTLFAAPARPVAAGAADRDGASGLPEFVVVRRGYERGQVDEFVASVQKDTRWLRAVLADTQRRLKIATQHAEATEDENRGLRASPATQATAPAEGGFGSVAEKFLRMAEAEAAEVRAQAVREAAELVERAQADAETSRHEAEQALIAHAADLDQAAASRSAELRAREDLLASRLDAVRVQADQVHAAAVRDAERLRREVEAEAESVRARLRTEVDMMREQARLDVDRLAAIRNDARAEIERITRTIATELAPRRYSPATRPEMVNGAAAGEAARQGVLCR